MAKTTKVDNMSLWKRVEKTNPKYVKTLKTSWGKMSTPNAQYQRMSATEEFGVYGVTWGLKEVNYTFLHDLGEHNESMALCNAKFFTPDGEFAVSSSGKFVTYVKANAKWKREAYVAVDEDFAKKIETDIVTKALSFLGFNADIFLGNWDDNKYVAAMTKEFAETDDNAPVAKKPAVKKLKAMSEKVHTMGMDAINSGDAERIKQLKLYLAGIEESDKKKEMLDLINQK